MKALASLLDFVARLLKAAPAVPPPAPPPPVQAAAPEPVQAPPAPLPLPVPPAAAPAPPAAENPASPPAQALAVRLARALHPVPPGPAGRPRLVQEDFTRGATLMGSSVPAIRAVVLTEVGTLSGFLADGRARTLFEAHRFSARTSGVFDKSWPKLSSRAWNRTLYLGGAAEWDRIEAACRLDPTAGLMAASYGIGQVMGENFKAAGYADPFEYVAAMHISEGRQLDAMLSFVKSNGLAPALRAITAKADDCRAFAKGYNGSGYEEHGYHVKLAANFAKIIGAEVPRSIAGMVFIGMVGAQVRRVQEAINAKGQLPALTVDGAFGPATQAAVMAFQARQGLQQDGAVGPATAAALGM